MKDKNGDALLMGVPGCRSLIRLDKTTGYNVQWYDGKKRQTIHLGGKRYTKKTAERFKDIVEALLFYRRNGITTPKKSVEHWMKNAPVELKAKLAKAELLTYGVELRMYGVRTPEFRWHGLEFV